MALKPTIMLEDTPRNRQCARDLRRAVEAATLIKESGHVMEWSHLTPEQQESIRLLWAAVRRQGVKVPPYIRAVARRLGLEAA